MIAIIKLTAARVLANNLPEIIMYILTKALMYVTKKYPHKSEQIKKEAKEMIVFCDTVIDAIADNKITKGEAQCIIAEGKKAFSFK